MAQNSLTNRQPQKQGITQFLSSPAVQKQITDVVGGKDGQKFITSVVSAVNATPALMECDNASIFCAALLGQTLKLSPSPQLGHFYMVPYNDNKTGKKVAQFQMGYKGYIQLALRSGMYCKLNVISIKEGELVKFDPLNEEIEVNIIPDPDARETAKTIGYYAMFEYTNGFRKAIYWSKEKMLAHADKYSQAFSRYGCDISTRNGNVHKVSFADYEAGKYDQKQAWLYSSFWYKDFDGMAYKTMLRQLISKWGIMSIEMQSAMESDMGVVKQDNTVEYIDNQMIVDMEERPSGQTPVNESTDQTQNTRQTQQEEYLTAPADPMSALFG